MFLVLAFQGFKIEFITSAVNTVVFQEILLVYLNWMRAIWSMFITLLVMVGFLIAFMRKTDNWNRGN